MTDGVLVKGKAYRRGDELDVEPSVARMLEHMGREVQIKEVEPQAKPETKVEQEQPRGLTTESFPVQGRHQRHKKGN